METLSVVLISKNQAWNIPRLVESVLREASRVSLAEIVLVDSASTDATTDIARRYPIGVLRLRPEQRLTAAAGRYVGYRHTTGDLVLFLDGDMELVAGWLDAALRVLRAHPDIALLTGQVRDRPKAWAGPASPEPDTAAPRLTPLDFSGGAALYRRAALDAVGPFNPFLYSEEEPELCLRLRHADYRIARLEQPLAYHYSDPDGELATVIGRWQRNLYVGAGQNMRAMLGTPLFWPYVLARGYALPPLVAAALGLAGLITGLLRGDWRGLRWWALALLTIVATDAARKRSLRRALVTVFKRLCMLHGAICGASLKPLPAERYATLLDVVQPPTAPTLQKGS